MSISMIEVFMFSAVGSLKTMFVGASSGNNGAALEI